MADNVTADPAAGGATFATDDIGGVHHPYAKMEWGADNTATKVTTGGGALPIQDGGNSITVDGSVTATGPLTDTELRATPVPVDASGAAVPVTDNGGSLTVDGTVAVTDGGGSITVDGTVAVTNGALGVTGGGVEATALRVTVATDSTGVLSVDDNGGSITVDGPLTDTELRATAVPVDASGAAVPVTDNGGSLTVDGSVTANAGTNLNTSALALEAGGNLAAAAASLSVVDDWDESDRAKVNPIAGQAGVQGNTGTVTALTQRVVLATDVALPAGTNAIGKLSANSGVDIGDVDVTSIAAGTNLIGDVALAPRTSGGCSIFKSLDLDETEEEVKGSAGQLYGFFFFNAHASANRYLKFYNNTAAGTTVGTTTPVMTVPIVAGSSGHITFPTPIELGAGITVAATTGLADSDTGAPGANEVIVWVEYE